MFRHLILPTLVAILLIPDWASAFFRKRTPAPVCPAMPVQRVQYPVYVAPPCPPMFLAPPVACCPPATVIAPAKESTKPIAPQVVPERMATPKSVAPESTKVEPLKPEAKPEKLVEPKLPSLVPNPDGKLSTSPATPVDPIKPAASEEKLPPVSVPLNPPTPAPMLPKLSLPESTPSPTPAPAKDSNPVEIKPTPVSPEKTPEKTLPKLELPNLDLPSAPPLAVPKEVEVKSSPIAAEKAAVTVELFPKDGLVPSDPNEKRIVTFYNFSGRDQILTIDGKSYTLPAKHTVEGKLNPQFKLRVGLGEEQEMKLPASAPGAEIVLKK